MAKGRRKRKKRIIGAGGVILGTMLSLMLAVLTVCGLYFWGMNQPDPTAMRDPAGSQAREVSLYVPEAPVEGDAPVPVSAPQPEQEALHLYTYDELVCDEDGLFVSKIIGKRYVGYVAIIDDPLRLTLGKCPYFGDSYTGLTIKQMAEQSGAVLAVNGGGFNDIGGVGLGGMPTGNVVYEGNVLMWGYSHTAGIDAQGVLHVGEFTGADCQELGLQWAVSYGPTLIRDGTICSGLDTAHGEPRTAIGQRENRAIVIVVLQGRQVQSLGLTCQELAELMQDFGCVNAQNLDGGASSDMLYKGEYLNVANTSGGPRPIPTGILVLPASGEQGAEE